MSAILVKTPEQIAGIRRSCKLAAEVLTFIEPHIQAGVTTAYLDRLIDGYIKGHGAISACLGYRGMATTPFPKATCISLNEVICHGIPSEETVLKEGDILNIDVTTILDGYYGDTSRMFSVGVISEEAAHVIRVARECLDIGIREVRPNNYFGNIGWRIWQYAMLQGCTVVEAFAGHGVGVQFHEPPAVPHIAEKDSGPRMKAGYIFTVEPMINLGGPGAVIDERDGWTVRTEDGKLSAQYEHTVLVTPTGVEILT